MELKKGVFFSIVSIFLVILFVASTELISEFSIKESEMEVTRTRVKILSSIINDFETVYFDKIIYVAAKNSLVGLSHYYSDHDFEPSYMKDIGFALSDVIYAGILKDRNNNKVNLTKLGYIDYDYTFNGLMESLTETYDKLGLEINYLTINFTEINSIEQIDPWTLQVNAEIDYYFTDKSRIASWKGFTTRNVKIPILGMYAFDFEGFPGNTKTNLGVIDSTWKIDNLTNTEPSILSKLSGLPYDRQKGICKTYCTDS